MPNCNSSAAATGLPATHRRTFLGGVAAAALVTAVPVAMAAAEPDAALAALHCRWKAAAEAYARALMHFEWLEDARQIPDPPEALFATGADLVPHFLGWAAEKHRSGRRWFGAPRSLDDLADHDCSFPEATEDGGVVNRVDARLAARRDEILAASGQWETEIEAVDERTGLTAARAAKDAAQAATRALRARIISTPATTLGGLRLKAEVALGSCCCTPAEWLEELDEGCASSEQIAATICVDLLAIARSANV